MPHQCIHCSSIYPATSKVIIEGCEKCGGHFFFYIREEQMKKIEEHKNNPEAPINLPAPQKEKMEGEIREMAGIENEEIPVILDLESVRVTAPGKYEIDVVSLFNKNRPLVFKLEEGKYIIDLSSLKREEDI
ncbi:hypothetical protein HYT24_01955 [Candidatus Pacearchaeota archaeon]|nr:hypothetical protein [Candidatus Pacearchaeota archaeon]